MAQQTINLGTMAGDGTGDTLRVAGTKLNSMLAELYTSPPSGLSGARPALVRGKTLPPYFDTTLGRPLFSAYPNWVDGLGHAFANAVVLPTALGNPYGYYGVIRLSTWGGPCLRVTRSLDNTSMDIGFVNNVVDKIAADQFAMGSTLTITTVYDQSGNGNNLAQATVINQPVFTQLNEWLGIRPITFSGWPAGTLQNLQSPTTLALNRASLATYMMVSPRTATQPNAYWEYYSDTSFATSAAYVSAIGGSIGVNYGTLQAPVFFPRSHLQTVSASANTSGTGFARFDQAQPFSTVNTTSQAITSFQLGKLAVNANENSQNDVFAFVHYSATHTATQAQTVEAALNAAFNPMNTASSPWTYTLIANGSSLVTGYQATLLQNSLWQAGFGRGLNAAADLSAWETFNIAIGGTTLAAQYASRAARENSLLATATSQTRTKKVCLIDAPSNDIASNGNFASSAAAVTFAQNLWNNTTVPYIAYLLAAGATKVVVPTIIARLNFDTTTNFYETARQTYNGLVRTSAGTNYTMSDRDNLAVLATPTSSGFSNDNIHPNNLGYAAIAALEAPLLTA